MGTARLRLGKKACFNDDIIEYLYTGHGIIQFVEPEDYLMSVWRENRDALMRAFTPALPRLRPFAWWAEQGDEALDAYPGARDHYRQGWRVSEALWLRDHGHLTKLDLASLPAEVYVRYFVYSYAAYPEAEWREKLRQSQEVTQYRHKGDLRARIPYSGGDECDVCGTPRGDLHFCGSLTAEAPRHCAREQCPFCGCEHCRIHREPHRGAS